MTPEKTVAIRDYLIAEHVPYEIWMMRKTHDTIIAGALTNKVALNAFIESFAIHERALIDFFNGRKGNDAAHFTVEKVWFAPVHDYDQVIVDPQVLHNDSFDEYAHPRAGTLRVLKHAVTYDGHRPGIRTPPPELGEQTREVLTELGYEASAIDELIASRALA